jgi:hypothetical protein
MRFRIADYWELAANKKLRERCHWQGARAGQCKTPDDG